MTPLHNGHAPESSRIPNRQEHAMQTSANHPLDLRDPYRSDDRPTDAANIVIEALRECHNVMVHFGDECETTICGGRITFQLPHAYVSVLPAKYPADMLAKEALEEAGLALLAASRRTEIAWREMQKALKS